MKPNLLIKRICFFLVVLSLIDQAVGGDRNRKNGRRCRSPRRRYNEENNLKGILGFNRTFILFSGPDFPDSGLTQAQQIQIHHRYFGRNRNDIVDYGRKFLKYIEERYGINFAVSNDDLLSGNKIINQGRSFVLNGFADPLGEFQLVFESDGKDAVTYPNPPPCSVGGYTLMFLRDYKTNGGCQEGIPGVIPAGSSLKYIDVICNTTEYCGLEDQISFTLIPERPILNGLINSKIVSEKYGEGVIVYPKYMTSGEAYGDIPFGIGFARFPPV